MTTGGRESRPPPPLCESLQQLHSAESAERWRVGTAAAAPAGELRGDDTEHRPFLTGRREHMHSREHAAHAHNERKRVINGGAA